MDQVITRWKRNDNGMPLLREGRPLLEFIAIKRRQDGMWAIPGSFVRPKGTLPVLAKAFGVTEETKKVSAILRRLEDVLKNNQNTVFRVRRSLHQLRGNGFGCSAFARGTALTLDCASLLSLQGYMDDVRNTDNAWVETEAINTHDDSGVFSAATLMQQTNDPGSTLPPIPCSFLGPSIIAVAQCTVARLTHTSTVIAEVTWAVAHQDLELFADHKAILERVVRIHSAYW